MGLALNGQNAEFTGLCLIVNGRRCMTGQDQWTVCLSTSQSKGHWPFGETWDTWSRGKTRWLPINITNESTVQHLHSCKPQPKIVELNKKRLSWNEKQLFSNITSAN